MSARHQEGLAHLLYGINFGGGFVALTGEVGTGKTTLCHCLLQQLPANVDIALILNPKLNAVELLAAICDELGISYDHRLHSLKTLVDALNHYLLAAHAKGRRTVLLIDEAQNLSLEVLEQVRLLTNLETSTTKLLQIILVGQPELKELLNRPDLRQLNQRITARYHLLPLSPDETREYIHHRLRVCNGNPYLFKDSAVRRVYKFSKGIPRIINILCDRALLGAYASEARVITAKIINQAAQETLSHGRRQSAALIPLLIVLAMVAGLYVFNQPSPVLHSSKMIVSGQLPKPPEQALSIVQKTAEIAPQAAVKAFAELISDPGLTLTNAISNTLKIWGKSIPANKQADCQYAGTVGLQCLFDKANWQQLLTLDRPAILEFSISADEKRYAVLTGIRHGQPVLRFAEDIALPLADVLSIWNGYYLMLWQPPRPGLTKIAPQQTSDVVPWLRQQMDAIDGSHEPTKQPLFFDDVLKARVIAFQRQNQLTADGIVGPRTIIHLDNATGAGDSPHLASTD